MLGICNGFQMLLEIGLLPGAMLMNRTLRFICRDVHLRVERDDLPLLGHLRRGQVLRLPIAHKEGNWFAPPEVVRRGRGTRARWPSATATRGRRGSTTRPTPTARSTRSPAS